MKLTQILERLQQPVPPKLISYKMIKGNRIDYISWVNLAGAIRLGQSWLKPKQGKHSSLSRVKTA